MGAVTLHLLLLSALLPAAPGDRTPQPASAYQQPGERVEADRDTETSILASVLVFYTPAGHHSRWIDTERLPAAPGVPADALDARRVDALVTRLGAGRFCAAAERRRCRSDVGGRLRVSAVYRSDDSHARVAVLFEHAWPGAPRVSSTQVFHLVRDVDVRLKRGATAARKNGWRITGRELATEQAP
jgi:hypothetical protein